MKLRTLLLALLVALAASSADAYAWSRGCNFTGGTTTGTLGTPAPGFTATASNTLSTAGPPQTLDPVGVGTVLCLRWVAADTTTATPFAAGPFQVTAPNAQVIFDPALDAVTSAAGTALVKVHACGAAVQTLANPEFSCLDMGGANGNASLSGVEGPDSTQNAIKWIGPGTYVIRVTGACPANKTCQVMLRGSN